VRCTTPIIIVLLVLGAAIFTQASEVLLPDGSIARLGKPVITGLAVAPDGNEVALATGLGVELIDTATLEPKGFKCFESYGWVSSVEYSPDGCFLAFAGPEGEIRVWDRGRDQLLMAIPGHRSLLSLEFSPDSRLLAAGPGRFGYAPGDCTVRIWNTQSGELEFALAGHEDHVSAIAFTPDGDYVVTGSHDSSVRIWSASTGELVRTLEYTPEVPCGEVDDVAISPDGRVVAAACDRAVCLWSIPSGTLVHTLSADQSVDSISFSGDGEFMALATTTDVCVWDTRTWTNVMSAETRGSTFWKGERLAFFPDDEALVVADNEGILIVGLPGGQVVAETTGRSSRNLQASFSHDSLYLATHNGDTVTVWVPSDPSVGIPAECRFEAGRLVSLSFAADSHAVIGTARGLDDSGQFFGAAHIWDTRTSPPELVWTHKAIVDAPAMMPMMQLSSDLEVLVEWAWGGGVAVRSVESQEVIWQLPEDASGPIALSRSGDLLATCWQGTSIAIWDIGSEELLGVLPGHKSQAAAAMSLSADGRLLASCGDHRDKTIAVWDLEAWELVQRVEGLEKRVTVMDFHPTNQYLIGGSFGEAYLWEIATGEILWSTRAHQSYITAAAFSPDGRLFVTGGEEGTALVWEAAAILAPATNGQPATPAASIRSIEPVVELWLPDGTYTVRAVAMWGLHAYLLTRDGDLYIFDLGDVRGEGSLGVLDEPVGQHSTGLGKGVMCNGTALYVYGNNGLAVYDISDPVAPHLVQSFPEPSVVYDLALGGGVLFAAAQGGIHTYGFSLSAPTHLAPLGEFACNPKASVFAVSTVAGNMALSSEFVMTTTQDDTECTYTLRVLDASDPSQLREISAHAVDFVAYEIRPWTQDRIIILTSEDVRLVDLTEDFDLSILDVESVPQPRNAGGGARTAARAYDYLITNGSVFLVTEDSLERVAEFAPTCICADGFPYPGAEGMAHVAVARSCSAAVFPLSAFTALGDLEDDAQFDSACTHAGVVGNLVWEFWEIDETLASTYGPPWTDDKYRALIGLNEELLGKAIDVRDVLVVDDDPALYTAMATACEAFESSPYKTHAELWLAGDISGGNEAFAARNDALGVLFTAIRQIELKLLELCSTVEIHPWSSHFND
jgi:WD40 repeat protein